MMNLFEQEVHEVRETTGNKDFADPSHAACIIMLRFSLWYGAARRIPQSSTQAALQLSRWDELCQALQDLYPEKDWSHVKKFHNAGHHVHSVGFAFGCWELASTNMFEVMNKFMKRVATNQTNRKQYEKQVCIGTVAGWKVNI